MGTSVVLRSSGLRLYRDLQLLFPTQAFDCQGAELGCNRIVVFAGTLIQFVGELVLGASYQGLAAGHIVARAFAFHKAVLTSRHFVIGQRFAVVLLAVCCRCQRHIPLLNRQRAGLGLHCELIRHIVACGILHHSCAGYIGCVGSCIRAAGAGLQSFHRIGLALNFKRQTLEAAYALLRTVIRHSSRARHYRDLALLFEVRRIGGVGGHIGGFILRFCADYMSIRIRPVNEVIASIRCSGGTLPIPTVVDCLLIPADRATLFSYILYKMLQLCQRYGNRCAAGDIVHLPVCSCATAGIRSAKCDLIVILIGLCSCLIGRNACNAVALRNINLHQEVRCIKFHVVEGNRVRFAFSESKIQSHVWPLCEADDSSGINPLTVLDDLHSNEISPKDFLPPLGVEGDIFSNLCNRGIFTVARTSAIRFDVPAGEFVARPGELISFDSIIFTRLDGV